MHNNTLFDSLIFPPFFLSKLKVSKRNILQNKVFEIIESNPIPSIYKPQAEPEPILTFTSRCKNDK